MRTSLTLLAIAFLCVTAGCKLRQNMHEAPDRGGYASRSGQDTSPVPNADEYWYTWQANDTLQSVAKRHGMDMGEVIRRNDLDKETNPKVGQQIIVKKPR